MPREGGLRTVPPHKPLVSPPRVVRLDGGTQRPHHRRGGHHVPPIHSQVRQGPPPDPPGRWPCCSQALVAPSLHERRRPGPVPAAPRQRHRHPGQPGPAVGGAEEGGRLRGPPRPQPPDRRPLLLHPPPRHRRLAHQHLPGPGAARSTSPRAGSTPSSTRPWTSSPSFTRSRHTCWCWPSRAPGGGDHHVFHALIPVHQPNGLWDKVLGALDPDRWARAAAKWVIQGVHGTLCGVVQKVSASDLDECRGG